jgi:CheY-like chemotaxis protein
LSTLLRCITSHGSHKRIRHYVTQLLLIAMVDDDPAVVQLVTTFLEAHGYHMISCYESAAALPLIHSAQPDLVLLDIQMEQWDAGLQLLAALRRNPASVACR